LVKDFAILLPKKGTLFAPIFAPSMQNRNSLTPPHMYLWFYVGEYMSVGVCVQGVP
jgi:hypothetical protein